METSATPLSNKRLFDALAVAFIVIQALLLVLNWHNYPTELDTSYHLLMGKMFAEHGKVVLWDSLEFAPVGRPQLYPPLEHIVIWLTHAATQASYMDTGRLIVVVQALLGLGCAWLFPRYLFGTAAGLFSLLFFASSTECWWWQTAVVPTAIIGALFLPFLFLFYKKRVLGSILLLTACFYFHYGFTCLFVAVVFLATLSYGPYRRQYLKNALVVTAASLAFFGPWIWHMARYKEYLFNHVDSLSIGALQVFSLVVNFAEVFLQLNFFLWAFAIVGLCVCTKKRREGYAYSLLVAGFWSFFIFLFAYRGSRFNAHAPIFMAPLAGLGARVVLDMASRLSRQAARKALYAALALVALFSIFLELHLLTPSLVQQNQRHIKYMGLREEEVFLRPTPLLNEFMAMATGGPLRGKHVIRIQNIFSSPDTAALLTYIKKYVPASEIIHISNGALADYIVLETGRKTDWGMFWEVLTPQMKKAIDLRCFWGVYISNDEDFGDLMPLYYKRHSIVPKTIARIGRYHVGYLPFAARP